MWYTDEYFPLSTMMYGYGINAGLPLFFGIHVIAMAILIVGIALFIGWAIRYLTPAQLKLWSWWLIGIGIVLCIITLPLLGYAHFAGGNVGYGMMNWNGNGYQNNGLPAMMRGFYNTGSAASVQTGETSSDEARGAALWNQFQAKQTSCANLGNDDFEVIGEYVMGRNLGDAHAQMNAVMQQMMGQSGEEQMHILLGKRVTGCVGAATSSASSR